MHECTWRSSQHIKLTLVKSWSCHTYILQTICCMYMCTQVLLFKQLLGSTSVVKSSRFWSVLVCWLGLSHVRGALWWGVHRLPRGFCGTCWGRL